MPCGISFFVFTHYKYAICFDTEMFYEMDENAVVYIEKAQEDDIRVVGLALDCKNKEIVEAFGRIA